MTTRVITLWHGHVTSLTTSDSKMRFPMDINLISTAIKSYLKELYDKQNMSSRDFSYLLLHSWSFHMKFMELAEGSFYKFHMK